MTFDMYNEQGIFNRKNGNFEEALACFNKALQLKPDYANAYVNIGNVYFDMKFFEEAAKSYETALSIDPHLDVARRNLERSKQQEVDNKTLFGRIKSNLLRKLVSVLVRKQ